MSYNIIMYFIIVINIFYYKNNNTYDTIMLLNICKYKFILLNKLYKV